MALAAWDPCPETQRRRVHLAAAAAAPELTQEATATSPRAVPPVVSRSSWHSGSCSQILTPRQALRRLNRIDVVIRRTTTVLAWIGSFSSSPFPYHAILVGHYVLRSR